MDTQPFAMQQPGHDAVASALRERLVDQLRMSGVLNEQNIERALRKVPRHIFLPGVSLKQAYADIAVPTRWEDETPVSSASQPSMVAIMLEQLQLSTGMRVLEIGAGTGYNAALMAELTGSIGRVITLDIDPEIVREAQQHLAAAGYRNVEVIAADGSSGYAPGAPYDRIILTVGASNISPAWVDQLTDGGLLVIPLWLGGPEASVAFRKHEEKLESESLAPCGFMRLRGSGATAEEWASLPDGRFIFAEHAQELAPEVHALLHSRPRRRLYLRPDSGLLQRLGLRGCTLVAIYPANRSPRAQQTSRKSRGHWGVFARDEEGPSLALFATLLPMLLVFGGPAAENQIKRVLMYEASQPALPLERWKITAFRRDSAPEPSPGIVRVQRDQFTIDVRMYASQPRDAEWQATVE